MPYNLYNAAQVTNHIALAATGTVMSAASLVAQNASGSIGAQLNVTHAFMYLQIPLWWFFVASVVLAFVGAFLALYTDTLKHSGGTVGKLLTATAVGLLATFVFLPAVVATPNVIVMMLTSLGGGFSGTVLLYLAARLVNNKQLHDEVIDEISAKLVTVIRFLLSLLPGGRKDKGDNDAS